MKKKYLIVVVAALAAFGMFALAGCGSSGSSSSGSTDSDSGGTAISVYSREDGSGTRGAFVELTGVQDGDTDNTVSSAIITNSTSVMLTSVAGDANGIGYVSLGSLNDTVKAVKVDGVKATAKNVKNGSYPISRPFNVVTKSDLSKVGKDFLAFILSDDGQKVVTDNGYVSDSSTGSFKSSKPSGKLVVAGSSSVSPCMEKLIEAYKKVNPNAEIELQTSDSTTGINMAKEGTCDIGMASRDLKDSEKSSDLTSTVIAKDGIAVIVNNDSSIDELTTDQIKSIYTGETTTWEALQ
ncbi:MAG: substrate-binding domain-containing protein [Eggerthellaceae bacterium]|jgi:phosphate transport system substrate-binding protein